MFAKAPIRVMAKAKKQIATTGAGTPDAKTLDELQQRAEEVRDSVAQTVTEIKETVTDKYECVAEALDWREQYRKHPAEWALAALVIGFATGYGISGALGGSKFFARLRDEAEDFGDRLLDALADLGDEAITRLGDIEHLISPALVGAVAPVLANQLKEWSGLELGSVLETLIAGDGKLPGAKGKKSANKKKKKGRKAKAGK